MISLMFIDKIGDIAYSDLIIIIAMCYAISDQVK